MLFSVSLHPIASETYKLRLKIEADMDQHYHPIIFQRLRQIFEAKDWTSLIPYLNSLSNAHFRTAGYLIGERLLPTAVSDDFWTVALLLIQWQPKAFTVTLAKAATPRLQQGSLSIDEEGFLRLATFLKENQRTIDQQKILMLWLPAIRQPATMERLFDLFCIDNPRQKAEFLLRTDGLVAGFVLLRTMLFEEHDRVWLASVCRQLMKRSDSQSFNLASIFRTYFDLQEVRGTFSLSIQPYEMARLDTDFEVFCRVATKV